MWVSVVISHAEDIKVYWRKRNGEYQCYFCWYYICLRWMFSLFSSLSISWMDVVLKTCVWMSVWMWDIKVSKSSISQQNTRGFVLKERHLNPDRLQSHVLCLRKNLATQKFHYLTKCQTKRRSTHKASHKNKVSNYKAVDIMLKKSVIWCCLQLFYNISNHSGLILCPNHHLSSFTIILYDSSLYMSFIVCIYDNILSK